MAPTPVAISPFDYLRGIDQRGRELVGRLPAQEEARLTWKGVLFRMRGQELLAPMMEISEIVTPFQVTRVPGVKAWALGMANMRGKLLPVMDLQGFVFGENLAFDPRRQRLLVVDYRGIYAGLLVEAVIGMKHFREDEHDEQPPESDVRLLPFLAGAFRRAGEHYAVFSPWKLVGNTDFLNVSA